MTVYVLPVGASADDADEFGTTVVNITRTDTGNDLDQANEWAGTRFTGGPPQGDAINSASVEVEPTASTTDEPLVTLWGEDVDAAAQYAATNANISGRTRTTASVAWDNADLGADGTSRHSTPDISAIVQEIVDRAGYSGVINIIWQGGATATRDLRFKTYDSSSADAAVLTIDATTASAFVPRLALLGVG